MLGWRLTIAFALLLLIVLLVERELSVHYRRSDAVVSPKQQTAQDVRSDEYTGGRKTRSQREDVSPAEQQPSISAEAPRGKHLAIAFYGLTRSLGYTIESIQKNVFDVLQASGYTYDVYLHTYNLESLDNVRSGEKTQLNTTEWRLLRPDYVSITDQDEFLNDEELPFTACTTFETSSKKSASIADYYDDNFRSERNLLCQLNSIELVTQMWQSTRKSYHAIVYLRPDMLYNCPLPVHELSSMRQDDLFVADFHHWRGYNDRFAMGSPYATTIWANRLHFLMATCMQNQIHAEVLVKRVIEHYKLNPVLLPFYMFRVRADGRLEKRDFNKRFVIPQCDARMLTPFVLRSNLSDVGFLTTS